MTTTTPRDQAADATSESAQCLKAGVMPLFSSWIYLCQDGPGELNGRLEPFEGSGERISIAFNATNP